jgi:hypothetical protein
VICINQGEKMKIISRLGFATLVGTFLLAGTALAASAPDVNPPGPTTHTRTLNLKGIGGPADSGFVDGATGACNVDPWVDVCSGAHCSCEEIAVSNASGGMEKGKQTVTNVFVTVDNDVNPATEPPPGGNGPGPRCNPFVGILTDTSVTETKTLNLFGVSCKKVNAISKNNPSGYHVSDTIVGGWGIAGAPNAPSPDASGWGTLSGTENHTTNAVSIKISGLVTQ